MSEAKKQCYLWGIWLCWGISIIAFVQSARTPLYLSLGGIAFLSLLLILPFLHTKRKIVNVFNFNRKDESNANDAATVPAKPTPAATISAAAAPDESGMKETVISLGTVLCGEITNENNISVNGVVEGDLISQKVTQIGKEGKVFGKVKSTKLVVNGLLKGSCYAKTVIIMSRGRIEGEVFAGEFSIEKGGVFIGNSHQVEESPVQPEKKDKKSGTAAERVPALTAVENTPAKNAAVDNTPVKNSAVGDKK